MQTEAEKEAIKLAKKERDIISYARFAIILNLSLYYGIAISIWGLALRVNLLWSFLTGTVLGLIVAFTFCLATIATRPKSMEEIGDRKFFVGSWDIFAIVIGIAGLAVWMVRILFFR